MKKIILALLISLLPLTAGAVSTSWDYGTSTNILQPLTNQRTANVKVPTLTATSSIYSPVVFSDYLRCDVVANPTCYQTIVDPVNLSFGAWIDGVRRLTFGSNSITNPVASLGMSDSNSLILESAGGTTALADFSVTVPTTFSNGTLTSDGDFVAHGDSTLGITTINDTLTVNSSSNLNGLVCISGDCRSSWPTGSLSGTGATSSLTYWTGASTLAGTTTPTANAFVASSAAATSTFAGPVAIGNVNSNGFLVTNGALASTTLAVDTTGVQGGYVGIGSAPVANRRLTVDASGVNSGLVITQNHATTRVPLPLTLQADLTMGWTGASSISAGARTFFATLTDNRTVISGSSDTVRGLNASVSTAPVYTTSSTLNALAQGGLYTTSDSSTFAGTANPSTKTYDTIRVSPSTAIIASSTQAVTHNSYGVHGDWQIGGTHRDTSGAVNETMYTFSSELVSAGSLGNFPSTFNTTAYNFYAGIGATNGIDTAWGFYNATSSNNMLGYGSTLVGTTTALGTEKLNLTSTATTTQVIDSSSVTQGACIKLKDTDGVGFTYVSANNGVLTASTASCL